MRPSIMYVSFVLCAVACTYDIIITVLFYSYVVCLVYVKFHNAAGAVQ